MSDLNTGNLMFKATILEFYVARTITAFNTGHLMFKNMFFSLRFMTVISDKTTYN